jgi:mRNA interferase MazF
MINFEQGSIVLVDFTYSNQQQSKLRPALVISNSEYNRISRDVIVMKITSKIPKLWSIRICNEDLLVGSLDYTSYAQTDSLYSLEKKIIVDSIGIVSPEKLKEIKTQISELFALH